MFFVSKPGNQRGSNGCINKLTPIMLLTFILTVFVSQELYAQTDIPPISNVQIIPPSPDAAQLGKYGDVQANLFNGISGIKIPIYEIKLNDFVLPISLSYDASGNKVDEVSSVVGLGWSLNAGGVVTTSVRGGRDKSTPWFAIPPDFDPYSDVIPSPGGRSNYQWAKMIIDENYDTQQDLYFYNFGDYTGKFMFDTSRTKVIPIPYVNLKFSNNGYDISDPNGNRYIFGNAEFSYMDDRCVFGRRTPRSTTPTPSSTYLSRIVTKEGRQIFFEYEIVPVRIIVGYDETRYVTQSGSPSGSCAVLSDNDRLCAKINFINQVRLKKIRIDDSSLFVDFIYDTTLREDIAVDNQRYGNRLKTITVSTAAGVFKTFNLSHDYFRTSRYNTSMSLEEQGLNSRLKLLSVNEVGKAAYVLDYNETDRLPARLSFAQDEWGYYNGANTNTTLIPKQLYLDGTGANRASSSNQRTAFMLQKISYPTGGATLFRFEPHLSREQVPHTVKVSKNFINMSTINKPLAKDSFVLTRPYADAIVSYYIAGSTDDRSQGRIDGPGGFYLPLQLSGTVTRSFPAGKFYVSITNNNRTELKYVSIGADEDSTYYTTEDIPVGGVRVAKTTDISLTGDSVSQFYNYNVPDSNFSSISYTHKSPFFSNDYYTRKYIGAGLVECPYKILSSSSFPDLGNEFGEVAIGYKYVTVTRDSLGLQGRTRYKFSTQPADLSGDIRLLGNPEWCRGLNLETTKEKYDPSSKKWILVGVEKSFYKTNINPIDDYTPRYPGEHEATIPNFKLSYLKKEIGPLISGPPIKAEFIFETFNYISAWVRLNSKENYYYHSDGTLYLKDQEVYTYQNYTHVQPTIIESTDSKGTAFKMTYKYPHDYAGQSVYDTMINRNLISPVIQQEVYKNNVFVKKRVNNYALFGKLPLKSSIQDQTGTNSLETMVQFIKYDSVGNLLQISKFNDVITSYIWGYNNNFPVAAIVGADYSTATSGIDLNIIKNPLNDLQLRNEINKIRSALPDNIMVSSYTYKPWIGMTSSTEPNGKITFFEYDTFGRLKVVKDLQGYVLKHYDYQYQQPITK